MRRAILLVVAAVIGFTSCKRDDAPEGKKEVTGITTLTAGHDQPGTRISISIEHEGTKKDQTLWRAGDKLYIYELQRIWDFTGGGMDFLSIRNEYADQGLLPIVFDITSGVGSTSAKFELNSNEQEGLDPGQQYVAIHTNGGVGGDGDIVSCKRPMSVYNNATLRLGGGFSSTSSGNGSELCEDNIVLYAPIEFDENSKLEPLQFKPTAQSIMEFNLKLEDGNTDNVTLSYIKLTATNPKTGAPAEVFAEALNVDFKLDKTIAMSNGDDVSRYAYKFTSTGNLLLKSSESTRFRFPISWGRLMPDNYGSKKIEIEIEIGVKVGGVDMIHTETFTKSAAHDYAPAFLPGVTYSKPITIKSILPKTYAIGDYYPNPTDPATAEGVVFWVNKSDGERGTSGKIVSLEEGTGLQWSIEDVITGAKGDWDGYGATKTLEAIDYSVWEDGYPASNWVYRTKNNSTKLIDGGRWYIPGIWELKLIYAAFNGDPYVFNLGPSNAPAREAFNKIITAVGGTALKSSSIYYYWSSTETDDNDAQTVSFYDGATNSTTKRIKHNVRAVRAF